MALNPKISNAAALAMLDALVDLLDAGAGPAVIKIYDGSQPAGPDVAVGAQVLLAEVTCDDPAFGNAADDNPGAVATAGAITGDTAVNATGTATWFRAEDSNGVAIIDGSCGTSAADLILSTVSLVQDGTFDINSWNVRLPEG